MRLNNNIFENYFAALNKHIIDVKIFHNKTELLSTRDEIDNLHAEDLADQVVNGSILGKEITRADKILMILKEIAIGSTAYQNKLSELMPIFGNIMSTITVVE